MGRAVVTANLGESLYRVRLLYDHTALTDELAEIARAEAEYAELMAAAVRSLAAVADGLTAAREALEAVLAQWSTDLIAPEDPTPPPDFPGGGATGEAAASAQLLAAINAARSADSRDPLTESAALSAHIRDALEQLANLGRTADTLYTPEQRVARAGYAFDAAVGCGEMLAFGPSTPEAAVAGWLHRTAPAILEPGYTAIGVRALYRPTSPWGYVYGVLLCAPGTTSTVAWPPEDPAKRAADAEQSALETVATPQAAPDTPPPVRDAVAVLAKSGQAHRLAALEVERMRVAHAMRQERQLQIEDLLAAANDELYAWACQWSEDIPLGATVRTAEVPGWRGAGTPAVTTMGQRNDPDETVADYLVTYTEHPINIVPDEYGDTGTLRWSESLSDPMCFVNAALEPGWLRWQPLYRYGTIAAISGSVCTVTLDALPARGPGALPIDQAGSVAGVPIVAACPTLYVVGDAVLIRYVNQDRAQPQIIGWRREPLPCTITLVRISWGQIV